MSAALALDGVSLAYGAAIALDGLSLEARAGETTVLVGASGSGKTSVLRALMGLLVPSRGTVTIAGTVATRDGAILVEPERRNLAVVFQDLALWPHMTVHGNLAFAMDARGVARGERDRRIDEMLASLGLDGRARRHPRELSGGERQRVALARALVVEPAAILLDEPLASVDVMLKRELLALLRRTFTERRTTALYVSHDPIEARALADRAIVLERGRVVQSGTWAELRDAPATELVKALTEPAD